MRFLRQEYWSWLSFPPPEDLPNPGIEPASPALASGFFATELPRKPWNLYRVHENFLFFFFESLLHATHRQCLRDSKRSKIHFYLSELFTAVDPFLLPPGHPEGINFSTSLAVKYSLWLPFPLQWSTVCGWVLANGIGVGRIDIPSRFGPWNPRGLKSLKMQGTGVPRSPAGGLSTKHLIKIYVIFVSVVLKC